MSRTPWAAAFLVLAVMLAACDDPVAIADPTEPPVATRPANAQLGLLAFKQECSSCHASDDGFDLAFFAFPDSTIIRRAVAHVDTTTAFDITAYIATLDVNPVPRHTRSFQPGGVRVESDVEFARRLFGSDEWPSDWTSAQLADVDPTEVPVALSFPSWSVERSNLDWMPDRPFPDALLDADGGRARAALAGYRAVGSIESLVQASQTLRISERDPAKTEAPCQLEDPLRFQAEACFEARRWIATLSAQHMLREGVTSPVHDAIHDAWWDVGNAARKSIQHDRPIENAQENWANWMYLGWAFAPSRHASVYLATALAREQLPRHATFHALRAQVVREADRGDAYKDLGTAVSVAPDGWVLDVARFGYRELIDRLERGERPSAEPFQNRPEGVPESELHLAWEGLQQARWVLWRRLGDAGLAELTPLHDRVEELLPEV